MTSQNKKISTENAAAVKRSRSIFKARIILLAIVFAISAAIAIGFLSFYIKGWALIPKMKYFEYEGESGKTKAVYVSGIKCKYTADSSYFKQKRYQGEMYLKDGSTLKATYFKVEPGWFELRVDGYDGTFEFHFDTDNRPFGV